MKLSQSSENNVETLDDLESTSFGIDESNLHLVYESFINYSNPIGSIVREITSNLFDSHIEAKVYDENIEIEITDENRLTGIPATIIFRDFGVGISPQRMKEVYSKFFSSTKRDTNDQIGAKGLGAKSPLSYVDMFTLITTFNGIKYHYIIHKGKKAPEIDLLHKEEVEQRNGSEVIINIRNGDKYTFISEIKKQLRFFDNITYINCNIEPEFTFKGKHVIISEKSTSANTPMLCMGKVSYPIDTNVISIGNYYGDNSNIALYFEIGDIDVTWNREALEYNDKTKEAIKNKINSAKEELSNLINNNDKVKLEDYIVAETNYSSQTLIKIKDKVITIPTTHYLIRELDFYNNIEYPKYYSHIRKSLLVAEYYKTAKKTTTSDKPVSNLSGRISGYRNRYTLLIKGQLDSVKTRYILDKVLYIADITLFKIKSYDRFLKDVRTYKELEDVNDATLKDIYNREVALLKDNFRTYDDIEIDEEWLEDYKESKKRIKDSSLIPYTSYSCYNYDLSNGTREEISGHNLKRYGLSGTSRSLIIYDSQTNKPYIKEVRQVLKDFYMHDLTFIVLSKKNAKLVEQLDLPNHYRASKINNYKIVHRLQKLYDDSQHSKRINRSELPNYVLSVMDLLSKNTKRAKSIDYISEYDDNLSFTPEQQIEYETIIGLGLKYPILKNVTYASKEDIEKSLKVDHVNPRLYYLKFKREKENETLRS